MLGETDILRVLAAEKRLILPILPLMLTYCPKICLKMPII